jgi:renalase
LPGDCLWDAKLRIGVCGDWFAAGLDGSGRVENAYLSGFSLADAV